MYIEKEKERVQLTCHLIEKIVQTCKRVSHNSILNSSIFSRIARKLFLFKVAVEVITLFKHPN